MARCAIKVELLNDSYTELKGEIAGPPDTPYEGGNFVLEIKVPETYPFNPPKVRSSRLFRNRFTLVSVAGSIHNEDMAPEHLVGDRSDLFRHSKGPVGRRDDFADGAALAAGAAVRRGAG